jgi:chaperonin GroES
MMIEAARDITAVKDILTGDSGDKVQTATTTLAMIEQGLKVFTAIYKRIYRALKDEFRLLFEFNAKHIDEQAYYTFNDQEEVVEKDYDLKSMDVVPQADPKMVTDMQRSARAQVYMQIASDPALGPHQNPIEALTRIYDSVGVEEPEKLIVKPDPQAAQIQQQAAAVQLDEVASKAEKNRSSAQKDASGNRQTVAEIQMLPADKLLEAHKQDMADAHKVKDRDQVAMLEMVDHIVGSHDAEQERQHQKEQAANKPKEAA